MRKVLQRFDPGYLVILAICLLAVWSFLSRPGLPRETDAELHIFRLAELARLLSGGEFYPRWAPNFYYGYGYPIFNFYAPLSYYVGLPLALLPGLDAVAAVKTVFILGLLAAGLGMYGFVRDNWGRPAGFVAAAVYVYAPYVVYVDPHARGDLAEAFSLGLFPLALWSLDRLRRQATPFTWLVAVIMVAAIILSHNLMALVFFTLLLAWTCWLAVVESASGSKQQPLVRRLGQASFPRLFAALLLGVGLSAFFWLPVALEQDAVNLGNLVGEGSHFDFRNHFLAVRQLLGHSPRLDWGATEPDFAFNLGVAQWLLGGLGALAVISSRVRQRAHAAFFVLAAAALILMMLPLSLPLWQALPLLPFLQFPWRFLGATVALLAVLAGIFTRTFLKLVEGRAQGKRLLRYLPAALVTIVIFLSLPLLELPQWSAEPWDTSAIGVLNVETRGRWLGTTSTGDFVPATVVTMPQPNGILLGTFSEEGYPDRVNRATLPDGALVTVEPVTPLHTRYLVSSPRDFNLRLFQFAFPGWQATVDGRVVETELGLPEGFLIVPVPAGDHVVEVDFVDTPERRLAWAISLLSLVLSLVGAGAIAQQGTGQSAETDVLTGDAPFLRPTLVAVAALAMLYLLVLHPLGWLRYESTGTVALPAENAAAADFGAQIRLIGWDAPAEVQAGTRLPVTLYWKAQRNLDINFQVFVHLLRTDGTLVAQSDKLNPGEFPTWRWPLDQYVRDEHRLLVPEDLPPGEYLLSTGLWVQAEGWRLPLLDKNERQIGDHFVLETLSVR